MRKKLRVAVVGCGEFSRHFIPLFLAHPDVEAVSVCDLLPERAAARAEQFGVPIQESFEQILADPDINTVAIFTQRHLHGRMAVAALQAGKDVYSAVPMAVEVEDCKAIIEAVKETGNIYMMGETCVYYPSSMYCKAEMDKGTFGKFVYGESQYYHDLSHFHSDFRADRPASAVPPFLYPTPSTAMILHATGTHAVSVAALGYVDTEEETPFAVGKNPWDNVFSNEFSLMRLSNGGVARVNECRRIGYKAPSSCVATFYGTQGSYQFSNAQHMLIRLTETGVAAQEVSDQINPAAMTENRNDPDFKNKVANHIWQWDSFAPVQYADRDRLPESFKGLPNGHMASHQLLIDDFCKAAATHTHPYVHAWRAARYTVPGLIAHQSALQGGVMLDIPDFGEGPDCD